MDSPQAPDDAPSGSIAALFDQLCLRWAREADVVVQQEGSLTPTLVVLPRDKNTDEVAMRLGVGGAGPDGVAVYVTLGRPELRRALGYVLETRSDGVTTLRRADDPDPALFSWLDALLHRPTP